LAPAYCQSACGVNAEALAGPARDSDAVGQRPDARTAPRGVGCRDYGQLPTRRSMARTLLTPSSHDDSTRCQFHVHQLHGPRRRSRKCRDRVARTLARSRATARILHPAKDSHGGYASHRQARWAPEESSDAARALLAASGSARDSLGRGTDRPRSPQAACAGGFRASVQSRATSGARASRRAGRSSGNLRRTGGPPRDGRRPKFRA